MLFRLAETLEAQDRAAAAASLARVLISAGHGRPGAALRPRRQRPGARRAAPPRGPRLRGGPAPARRGAAPRPVRPADRLGARSPRVSREALRRSGRGSPRGRAPAARRPARRRRPAIPARRPRPRPRRDPDLAGCRRRGPRPPAAGGRAPRARRVSGRTAPPSCCAPSFAAAPRRRRACSTGRAASPRCRRSRVSTRGRSSRPRRPASCGDSRPEARSTDAGDPAGEISFVVQGSIDLVRPTPGRRPADGRSAGRETSSAKRPSSVRRGPAMRGRGGRSRCWVSPSTSSRPTRTAPSGCATSGRGWRGGSPA